MNLSLAVSTLALTRAFSFRASSCSCSPTRGLRARRAAALLSWVSCWISAVIHGASVFSSGPPAVTVLLGAIS